jgi:hypothetical protein
MMTMTTDRTSGGSDMREYFRKLCIRLGDLPDTSKPSLEKAVGATLTHPRLKEPLLIYAILDFRDGELLACCPHELRDHYLEALPVLRMVLSRPVAEWTPERLRETGLERIWWKHLSTYLAKTEWPEVERRRCSDAARKARIILESGLVSPAELAKATGYSEREIREVIWDRKSEPDDARTHDMSKAALRLARDRRISK